MHLLVLLVVIVIILVIFVVYLSPNHCFAAKWWLTLMATVTVPVFRAPTNQRFETWQAHMWTFAHKMLPKIVPKTSPAAQT